MSKHDKSYKNVEEPNVIRDVVESPIKIGSVDSNIRLNVRVSADSDAPVLAVLDAMAEVMVDLDCSTEEFYKITTAAGIEGFCKKQHININ